jgi:ketosteroid isomerase-like protein
MWQRWGWILFLLTPPPNLAQTAPIAHHKVETFRVKVSNLPTQRFADDLRSKNLEDVLKLYTPRAVFVDPSGRRYRGPAALRDLYSRVFATFDSDIVMNSESITQGKRSNVCIEAGSFTENLRTRATGTSMHSVGSYRFTYALQSNGEWLLSRQEWKIAK